MLHNTMFLLANTTQDLALTAKVKSIRIPWLSHTAFIHGNAVVSESVHGSGLEMLLSVRTTDKYIPLYLGEHWLGVRLCSVIQD